jgi:hypothetical protein
MYQKVSSIKLVCAFGALLLFWAGFVQADRVKRPMKVHQLPELGLEVWTEYDPLWITEIRYHGRKPVFMAQTPPLVYPPAAMSVVSFPGMSVTSEEMEEVARTAIQTGAKNYKVFEEIISQLKLIKATYGVLTGYESDFSGLAQGDEVDVKVFVGHQPGKGPVMLQIYTLKGKLPHVSEQIRRSWNNVSYLN